MQGDETNYDFTFDRIFGPESTQKEIFAVSTQSVVESVMNGYNGTIFAYGQTSSGKTFTMEVNFNLLIVEKNHILGILIGTFIGIR